MDLIKFGTDGWRALRDGAFNHLNVSRLSAGVALYMKKYHLSRAVIGYDTRHNSREFCELAATVLASYGIMVILPEDFVTTPMLSLALIDQKADLGIVITASHNPPAYNGYKIKQAPGVPASDQVLKKIERLIPEVPPEVELSFRELLDHGSIRNLNMEEIYLRRVSANFDLHSLRQLSRQLVYDSMHGAGCRIAGMLFPGASHIHGDPDPNLGGVAPEPIENNLKEMATVISMGNGKLFGLANDGDADRIGMMDEQGRFLDANHIMLLLLYYLAEIKGLKGSVIVSAATTDKIMKLCEHYSFPYEFTPVGYKHISPRFVEERALLGGEEAGGVALTGHIPERDGIWAGLSIMDLMIKSGKSLGQLVDEMYERVGKFTCDRLDLYLDETTKEQIMSACRSGKFSKMGPYKIRDKMNVDGYRYFFEDDSWLMIRPSGTEPLLRLYAQAADKEKLKLLLETISALIQTGQFHQMTQA